MDARLAEHPEGARLGVRRHELADFGLGQVARRATRATWYSAAAGLMCGSSPLPEAVTRSAGTGFLLPGRPRAAP